MRKLRKNAKALSPVVASIILIAVTVAVSIAVAAWMGALSIGFMETEQMSIVNAQFTGTSDITLSVRNTGTVDITITSATVNGQSASVNATQTTPVTVAKNSEATIVVGMAAAWDHGSTYQLRLLSTKGNYFPYNAVAP
jgi:flagellin-like protein